MAEALVSILLERLGSILLQKARLVEGVEEEVQNLTDILRVNQAVLDDAERRQLTEPTVKRWLDKLKDVCFDTDNVLDEWSTAILRMQTEVSSSIPYFFCCRQVALRLDIAIKIEELNKKLYDIAKERSKFYLALTNDNEQRIERQRTSSLVDVSNVYGREQDKKKIVDMLLTESSQGPIFRTLSIVGEGGIGKTTLAQLVYHDDRIKAHFEQRIWVCVSDPFDLKRIVKAIFEALIGATSDSNGLGWLLRCIHDYIGGKKFLLVLDDVWTKDSTKWESLKTSLKHCSRGSRILVTTRKERAVNIIGTPYMFRLRQLPYDECWLLFSRVAFSERTSEQRENLEGIGHRIVDKCNGLPLAVKVLGGHLCFKKTREEWESVLDSDIFKLEQAQRVLFSGLLVSYYDLPYKLRQCFLYCAIFPHDYEIKMDRLIKLWMAQGYLEVRRAEDMEMVGEEYFNVFIAKSFFENVKRDRSGTILTCQVNSTWHEFARFLTKKECSVKEVIECNRLKLNFRYLNVRHSMFILGSDVSIFAPIKYVKNLCSLIVEYKSLPPTGATSFQVLDQFTRLRAFDLSAPPLKKLPKEVGKLIHLRYLNLAYNAKLEELPETVCDLCNLQSLNVSHCMSLKNLPRGLGRLINLRHLQISSTGVSFMPRGVGRLTSLRTLDTFYVSSAENVDEASTLEDLKNLIHLRGHLEIRGLGKVKNVDKVKKAQLENKEHLIGLALVFWTEEDKEAGERMINDKQVIEALQPPPKLERLSISMYGGSVFPDWMMPHLHSLTIERCPVLDVLPDHILQSKSLKELEISSCQNLKQRYYNEREGGDWPKIARIPNIKIDGEYVQKRRPSGVFTDI